MILKNISKKYDDKKVVDNLNLELENKGLVFIVGKSGAGKSTLLHIMGLLDTEYEGSVIMADKEFSKVNTAKSSDIRNNIDFIFQEFNLIENLTVYENICMTACDTDNNKTVNEIIRKLDLEKCINRYPKNLSGGEKQRVAIARAIVRKSTYILADEPTGNLDSENEKIIFDSLKEIAKDRLVVVITHNKEAAEIYGDRIVTIGDGKVLCDEDKGYINNKVNDIKVSGRKNELGLKWLIKMSLKNLERRKKKIIPTSLMMLVCVLLIGFSFETSYSVNNLSNYTSNEILENDKKNVVARKDEIADNNEPFKEKFIEKILGLENINNCIVTNTITFSKYYTEENSKIIFSEPVENSGFYKKRYNLIEGRLPNSIDEIVVNKSFFGDKENKSDNLHNTVKLSVNGTEKKFIIVGIKDDTLTKKDEVLYFKGLEKIVFQNELDPLQSLQLTIKVDNEYCDYMHEVYPCAYYEDVEKQDGFELIYGKLPADKHEIIINVEAVNTFLAFFGDNLTFSNRDLIDKKLPIEFQNKIIGLEVNNYYDYTLIDTLKIVGICKTNDSEKIDFSLPEDMGKIFCLKEYVNTITKTPPNNIIYLYCNDEKTINTIRNLCKEYGYLLKNANEDITESISSRITVINTIFVFLCILIIIVVIFMLNLSSKLNMADSYYEIGVLKALGISNKDIFTRYSLENAIQGLIVGGVSSVLGSVVSLLGIVKIEGVNILQFNPLLWMGLVLFTVILSVVSTFIENIKIAGKNPLKCIKGL